MRSASAFAVAMVLLAAACSHGKGKGGSHPPVSGLTARPANPSCVAPARPVANIAAAVAPAFASLAPFTNPVAMLQRPGNSTRWYVVQRNGHVFTFPNDPQTAASTEFADLSAVVDQSGGASGLLGMAFDPDFDANGKVYFWYTITGPSMAVPLQSRSAQPRARMAGRR